jgi:hypothetical protein
VPLGVKVGQWVLLVDKVELLEFLKQFGEVVAFH